MQESVLDSLSLEDGVVSGCSPAVSPNYLWGPAFGQGTRTEEVSRAEE